MAVDIRYIERFARNFLANQFGRDIPTADQIASFCVNEWSLDIQDVATVLRIVSGEGTEHGIYK